MTFNHTITNRGGKAFRSYLATPPDGAKGPGIVLMHEVYGVGEALKQVADTFAQKGFVVSCPNMYWEHDEGASFIHRPPGPLTEEQKAAVERDHKSARDLMFRFTRPADGNLSAQSEKLVDYVTLAANDLRNHDSCEGPVAAAGFCFGARSTYLALAAHAPVDAGVAFFPTPELGKVFTPAAAMGINKPLLFIVGGEDPYITDDEKAAIIDTSATTATYVAGRKTAIVEANAQGNPFISTLYYGNSPHGWTRPDSVYSDPATAAHTLDLAAEFLMMTRKGTPASGTGNARIPPPGATYHPVPKV